jgi:hypothetical protein
MHQVAKNNKHSMVALHLPWKDVGNWFNQFEKNPAVQMWKSVKCPIIVASSRPIGFPPSMPSMPIRCSDAFFMMKEVTALRPTHNAFLKYTLNPKGRHKSAWSEVVVIPVSEFKKGHHEQLMKVVVCSPFFACVYCVCSCVCLCFAFHTIIWIACLNTVVQNASDKREEHTEPIDTIGEVSITEDSTEKHTLEKLQSKLTKSAMSRNNFLRKEQISLGVLQTVMTSLGRILYEQVNQETTVGVFCVCVMLSLNPNTLFCVTGTTGRD